MSETGEDLTGWMKLTSNVSVLPSGLCPDWETWDPSQPVENAREAMQQADDWLGVPQVTFTNYLTFVRYHNMASYQL